MPRMRSISDRDKKVIKMKQKVHPRRCLHVISKAVTYVAKVDTIKRQMNYIELNVTRPSRSRTYLMNKKILGLSSFLRNVKITTQMCRGQVETLFTNLRQPRPLLYFQFLLLSISVTRFGDLLDFGQLFKAFGYN